MEIVTPMAYGKRVTVTCTCSIAMYASNGRYMFSEYCSQFNICTVFTYFTLFSLKTYTIHSSDFEILCMCEYDINVKCTHIRTWLTITREVRPYFLYNCVCRYNKTTVYKSRDLRLYSMFMAQPNDKRHTSHGYYLIFFPLSN